MRVLRRGGAGMAVALAATVGLVQPDAGFSLQQESTLTRPDPDGAPTPVRVGMYVVDIEQIENARQQFVVDFVVDLIWRDPRLAGAPGRRSLHEVWHPQASLFNQRGIETLLPEVVAVEPDGSVRYLQRYYGSLAAPFDLRDFPFDTQALPVTLISVVYGPEQVEFVFAPELSGRAERFSVVAWEVGAGVAEEGAYAVSSDSAEHVEYLARIAYVLEARRAVNYYAWKVVLPLVIIVLMSWAVFWVDPKHVGPQLGLSGTSILTLVAFLLSLSSVLPPISYLTRLDVFVYASLSLQFLAFVEALGSTYLAARDSHQLALRMDRTARVFFPSAFLVINLWFWT
ncbi:MAG: hypothetical protein AMS20_01015 [Gemmatimonas sp. SG8_28]|jgi:hypothetical protein|nr:MAG: hypothetical protein AMS20_01015 [Gemmatimonas sp. SG8_28]